MKRSGSWQGRRPGPWSGVCGASCQGGAVLKGALSLMVCLGSAPWVGCGGDRIGPQPGPCRKEVDKGADGVVDLVEIYSYDASGLLAEKQRDDDGDGQIDAAFRYSYSSGGLLTDVWWDLDGDGEQDYASRYEYDSQGRATRYYEYDPADGDRGVGWVKEYSDDGLLVLEEIYGYRDATPLVHEHEYDDEGYLVHTLWKSGRGGTPTGETVVEWSEDRRTRVDSQYVYGFELQPMRVDRYRFDQWGNRIEHAIDLFSDGVFEDIVGYLYDAEGHLLRSSFDWDDSEGHRHSETFYLYDSDFNLMRERHIGTSGRLTRETVYYYGCWR